MKKKFCIDEFKVSFDVTEDVNGISYDVSSRREGGSIYIDLVIRSLSLVEFPVCQLAVSMPLNDMHSLWTPCIHGHPKSIRNKGIPEIWTNFSSHISHVSPVGCFYNLNGENKVAFAFSDIKNIVKVQAGAYEEETAAKIIMSLFTVKTEPMTEYTATLRLDTRTVSYHESIAGMTEWHENYLDDGAMPAPASAFEPVYSTWYSFHQNLDFKEIEDQCEMAANLGCKTIILDDGWQTDDSNRGYKFCGDWQVSEKRFPNMREHVGRVQSMGMKYMLWLSVPFVGQGCKVWDEFKSNLLFYSDQNQTGTLDPRYPKVRDFLVDTYCRVVSEFGLDGLKLDFIDEFDMTYATGNALLPDPERDTESLPEAVDRLMMMVRQELTKIKADILIEFRQRYIGSMIRKYGNIFRVHDCPHDSITNRAGVMDLRLFSGDTAIHSDMFIWSNSDTVESASLQFINTLFSVPQISPNLKEQSPEHLAMVKHWLAFWSANKSVLMNGTLSSKYPEMHYPVIAAKKGKEKIITIHADMVADIFEGNEEKVTIVNGSMTERLILRSPTPKTVQVQIYDCLGSQVESESDYYIEKLNEIHVPKSGYVVMDAISE
ncbi:alpha-galactosidase [Photobacterium sp. ZSDE20]|uniref:Alpha-galactosidase n=1 Tax=Photobacterium pectinilyticum TaxID=2906793 RepID=A0ABT1N4P7_9GAMM|nr:glycoside hydrolase family 36 protein [Photobacterium sp. ZSDE20]MCQ1059721.1 alpha-galactosidase [Photobacterium sp. ZSDE20]MDD1825927.1 alpha-galactosidase [Photobacterium sp. ZSDE20]